MQKQTTSTVSKQQDEQQQGNGGQENANDSKCEWRQMGGDVNEGRQQWQEQIWHVAAAAFAIQQLQPQCCTPGTYYPKTSPPTRCWPKLSSCSSIFGFLALIAPPLHATELHPPATSLLMYTIPIRPPLPKNQPTYIQLAKTEPPWLNFWFFGPNPWPQLGLLYQKPAHLPFTS